MNISYLLESSNMGNDAQFLDQPPPRFQPDKYVDDLSNVPLNTKINNNVGLSSIQTPLETLNERSVKIELTDGSCRQRRRKSSINAQKCSSISKSIIPVDRIFTICLFILLIILVIYLLFHGKSTDNKLNALITSKYNQQDLKTLIDQFNNTLKLFELLLQQMSVSKLKNGAVNFNLQLTGQELIEFYKNNRTMMLDDLLKRLKNY
ncbi:unnamed protein product [Didymodactylos carnosus]|uniref:Uncharacterized protein n=1 Tax=Didymodactylos carnosus TaxID=1234261 RepID=A0A813XXA5_9BILA|nr:unnamed protein product [Didymodactylos carnosus]CAF0876175.1 unnamed protein product [Didymodactylos carnosus]CAF3535663.1 unnamed protein product [Didymodactylos carnosus]CAF3663019.1 unnamed protein product [Didymodactylos carnosus]